MSDTARPCTTIFSGGGAFRPNESTTFSRASGAMLKGSGAIIGDVLVEGAISPGNSPGTMPIVGNSTWAGGGSYEWEINKADGVAGADPAGTSSTSPACSPSPPSSAMSL